MAYEKLREDAGKVLREVLEYEAIAEWICCDPVNPKHELCVQGDTTRRMMLGLLIDNEAVFPPKSRALDALMDEVVIPEISKLEIMVGRLIKERRMVVVDDELMREVMEGLSRYEEQRKAERDQMTFGDHVKELWDEAPWMGRLAFFGVVPLAMAAIVFALGMAIALELQ